MESETTAITQIQSVAHEETGAQFLTFILDGSEYGLEILRVQEIKGWDNATPIPDTPDYLRGVINLRGTVVPVIDLRLRFGLAQAEYTSTTVVIVVRAEHDNKEHTVGFVVDAVSEVYTVDREQIKPAPDVSRSQSDFVSGLITVQEEKMVILLDINQLVSHETLVSVA